MSLQTLLYEIEWVWQQGGPERFSKCGTINFGGPCCSVEQFENYFRLRNNKNS